MVGFHTQPLDDDRNLTRYNNYNFFIVVEVFGQD